MKFLVKYYDFLHVKFSTVRYCCTLTVVALTSLPKRESSAVAYVESRSSLTSTRQLG